MTVSRRIVALWIGLLAFASVPTALASGQAGGLGATVEVNVAVLLALTITPVETLVDAFRGVLPGKRDDDR